MASNASTNERPLAKILRQRGSQLVEQAVERVIPAAETSVGLLPGVARQVAGVALTRIATRSLPGALLVGGGLLARHLHKKRKAARAAAAQTPPALPAPEKG